MINTLSAHLKQQWVLCSLLLLCFLQALLFGWAAPETTFQYTLTHQYWRFFSAHITHVDALHFITNLCALMCLYKLFPINTKVFLTTIVVACGNINVILICLKIPEYAGLSGILYAYLGCICSQYAKSNGITKAVLLFIGIVIYATALAPMNIIGSDADFKPLLEAHMAGFFSGMLVVWLTRDYDIPERPMLDTAQ